MKRTARKNVKRKKVAKALSPEEQTALSNIQSILNEILQMGSGEAAVGDEMLEDEVMLAEDEGQDKGSALAATEEEAREENMDEKEVKMIIKAINKMKALESTESDAATASDDAEERMDDAIQLESEDNIQEVAKALSILLKGKKKVQKSAPVSGDAALNRVLNKIVDVQKTMQVEQRQTATALGHILEGMGVMKQLDTAVTKARKPKMINKAANDQIVEQLANLLGQKVQKDDELDNGAKVRKSLSDRSVLASLVGK